MGTIIKSVDFCKPIFRTGILKLTTRTAGKCLNHCGLIITDVGMLINTTLYTENHLAEPALSALILNKLQSLKFKKDKKASTRGKIFSFDLHGGSAGVMSSMQIVDGFIQSGQIENGLIIAGDIRPRSGRTVNYNYEDNAGAILLSNNLQIKGFNNFKTYTYPEFENDADSLITWKTGKFTFATHYKESYLNDCMTCVGLSLQKFFDETELSWDQIDLVVSSHSPAGFSTLLRETFSLGGKMEIINGKREIYTAGIAFSLKKAFVNGKFSAAKSVMFITVSSGISVSLSLYLNQ